MRSSTQERFRRDVLGEPPGPEAGALPSPVVVVAPPPAPDALTDLLAGYRTALQVADRLPAMLTVRAGDGPFTRRVRVPRMRMFLRYYLNQHVCRRLAHLKRAFHADAALGRDRMGELAAIDHFEQAIVPVPVRRILVWFAVSVLFTAVFLANIARALDEHALMEASTAIKDSIASTISVDPNGLINAAGKFHADSGVAAVVVISLSLYFISALPITSFRLKRMLFNLSATQPRELASAVALEHVYRAEGIYRDERDAFKELGVRPPKEIPFDLIAQAVLMLPLLVLGIALLVAKLGYFADLIEMKQVEDATFTVAAAAWGSLVIPLGRLAHLLGIWRRRVADASGTDRPHRFTPAELAPRGRRLGAFVVDTVLGFFVASLILPAVQAIGLDEDATELVWWFFGIPIGFALITVPFMLRKGKHAGQTLGKQLFGIRVVCDSHGTVSRQRAVARELLIKGPFWTGSVSLLFLPALVNAAWTVLDRERRGIQDRAVGTRVVRAARQV